MKLNNMQIYDSQRLDENNSLGQYISLAEIMTRKGKCHS